MRTRTRHAFTLVELVIVVTVTGILAATAIPALSSWSASSVHAARRELSRVLSFARSNAIATSRPTGVGFSADGRTLSLVWTASPGATPESLPDLFGMPTAPLTLGAGLGVPEMNAVLGDGASGECTLWFGHDGTPRSSHLSSATIWTSDARITLGAESTITVRRGTGVIE